MSNMLIYDREISHITNNSKEVVKGSLFAAIQGKQYNGENFIQEAIEKGAVAILLQADNQLETHDIINNTLFIKSANPRATLAKYSALFFKNAPAQITAVTGTNGKTSTVNFARQILRNLEHNAASIGTLGITIDHYDYQTCLTSPDCIVLHKTLQKLSTKGITDVIMEASSHALDQSRLEGVQLSYGLWTNFTQDHLDYHTTLEHYFKSKAKLIPLCQKSFVYNNDDHKIHHFLKNQKIKNTISFGFSKSDCQIISIKDEREHQAICVNFWGKTLTFYTKLLGHFQIQNLLGAIIIAYLHGCSLEQIVETTLRINCIHGRLELVRISKNNRIFIDFAHTPDGLEKVLLTLNKLNHNKIITIFGCGGDRDSSKRPLMGNIAAQLSDVVILTSDNSRTESTEDICAQILSDSTDIKKFKIILDREEAIKVGVDMLQENDILLIAGKGHEQFQIIGTAKIPFNDLMITKKILSMKNVPCGTF